MVNKTIEERADKQILKETHMDAVSRKMQRDFLQRARHTFRYSTIALGFAVRDLIEAIKISLKIK